ncbi:MAG TPA: protein-disulfide reductase DsbD [Rhizobiaceae bacterium]|nr:protein-disulfide reductase DsbD [Rhizobiaceae bacterium]
MMKTLSAILIATFLNTAARATPPEPLPPDEAFAVEPSASDESVSLSWTIAPGYYLYRDHFIVSMNGKDVAFDVSDGVQKSDPDFGDVEVLYDEAVVTVPGREGTATVIFQGCQDGGICYMPEVRSVDLATLTINRKATGSAPKAGVNAQTASLAEAGIVLADDTRGSSSVLRDGNAFWVALSFVGFGLLLAFTPCVFPMYPIVLGMIGQAGQRSSARRGFILSTTYVVSLGLAFGLVGAVVGWTGQNIQFALQSPLTTAAMSVLFIVLAAGSFGLFELQLPSFVTSRASRLQGGKGGSVARAAALGVTSSLIVGPCVTAPLAGALLYIGQGGDWRIGALSLFALGIGKGLPLIVLSTAGSKVLPKAGAWMETVRRLFGFAFLGMAVWIATPLLPMGYVLALYAALILVVAADLFMRARARMAKASASLLGLAAVGGLVALAGDIGTSPATARISIRSDVPVSSPLTFAEARTAGELVTEIEAADGRPILVYVTADWCVICRTIERSVLPDEDVVAALHGMTLVKLDVTKFGDDTKSVLSQLNAAGPPTMVFLNSSRREVAETRLIGSVSIADVVRSAGRAASR